MWHLNICHCLFPRLFPFFKVRELYIPLLKVAVLGLDLSLFGRPLLLSCFWINTWPSLLIYWIPINSPPPFEHLGKRLVVVSNFPPPHLGLPYFFWTFFAHSSAELILTTLLSLSLFYFCPSRSVTFASRTRSSESANLPLECFPNVPRLPLIKIDPYIQSLMMRCLPRSLSPFSSHVS